MTNIQKDCTFCEVLPTPQSAFDVNQPLTEDVSIMPALGMLVPGYFLAVSNDHITSLSQMGGRSLRRLDDSLSELGSELTPIFGDYFRIESGSDGGAPACGSGACITHAHQHLVPASDIGEHILDVLPWEQIDEYEDITGYKGKPYIYLGRAGLHYAVAEPNLPGQWMRRQFETVRGVVDWDWAVEPGFNNLQATFSKIEHTSLGQLALQGQDLMPTD